MITRPALRYHGGKWKLAPWIIQHFPKHRVYIEPFGGAASVLLQKKRSYAEVYNDLDLEIVNYFQVLRNPETAAELKRLLKLTPFARVEFELSYSQDNDPVEQARRTCIRAFMGFGSAAHNSKHATGFRANSNRAGTTPAHDWANWPMVIDGISERLQGVVIENRPAVEIILQHDAPNGLIYADPPYVHETRGKRQSGNYKFELSDQDHVHLAEILRSVKSAVVLSGYQCPLYDELFGDWLRIDRPSYADGNNLRMESLWLNPKAEKMQKQPSLFGSAV